MNKMNKKNALSSMLKISSKSIYRTMQKRSAYRTMITHKNVISPLSSLDLERR